LVAAYHDAGINIIMDVVYNHVSSLSNSAFNILAPKYYFRYTINGQPSNGSGCGNETASENAMFRKFMIDSTAFWAKEYKLGGFRFDLMGLHDIDTMNQVVASLKKINPSICVYGEPWTGGASGLSSDYTSAAQANMSAYDGFGSFNDKMRDGLIKGGMSGKAEKGWVTEATAAVPASQDDVVSGVKGFTGTISSDPDKAVIYASCHDNYTLTDRASAAGITDAEQLKYMPMLANALVLTSQGTSFILAGEEFLRTKKGDSNSYASSYAVNELDYALAISNADMVASYKKLIALKQSVDGLHLGKDEAKKVAVDVSADNQISYSIKDTANNKMYKIVHTNGYGKAAAIDMSGYTLELCTHGSVELSASTICPALSTVIGVKSL
jgi:pullulanase